MFEWLINPFGGGFSCRCVRGHWRATTISSTNHEQDLRAHAVSIRSRRRFLGSGLRAWPGFLSLGTGGAAGAGEGQSGPG